MANKKTQQDNEYLNFDFDVNGEVARFVIDSQTQQEIINMREDLSTSGTAKETPLGILKTSTNRILFNRSERYHLEEDLYFTAELLNGGTNSHDANKVSRVLSVTDTIGSKVIRQTRQYFRYIKGSPQTIIQTGNFNGAIPGVTKTVGYFDEENGIFLRLNGTTPQVGVRSKTSGTVADTLINQNAWNDPLDGTGESGITVDWTKQQFFYFDFAWLGIANIRYGMYLGGKIVIFHTISNSNIIESSWAQSAVLPMRAEIENVSGTATRMSLTCYSVSTEDGLATQDGSFKSTSSGPNIVSVGTTEVVIAAFRINPLYKGNVFPQSFAVIVPSGNSVLYYKILFNAVLSGAIWEDIPTSIVQKINNTPTFANGGVIDEGYAAVGASSVSRTFRPDAQLGRGLDEPDTIVIVARTLGGNSNVAHQISWREDT